jgi:hypothetical protein
MEGMEGMEGQNEVYKKSNWLRGPSFFFKNICFDPPYPPYPPYPFTFSL